MAAIAIETVCKLLNVKYLRVTNDYNKEVMPPVNTGFPDGELAWRQHEGWHIDAPNMKHFIEWANNKINYKPVKQGR